MKAACFGTFLAVPSDEPLKVYFQLTDNDQETISEMRLPVTPKTKEWSEELVYQK